MGSKNKIKKKSKIIIIVVSALTLLAIGIGATLIKVSQSMVIQPVNNIDLRQVNDGTYKGSARNELIEVDVEVTVSKNEITNIDILKHNNGLGGKAESIIEDILAKQSLNVDVISSASYSSNIILKSVENALKKGMNG